MSEHEIQIVEGITQKDFLAKLAEIAKLLGDDWKIVMPTTDPDEPRRGTLEVPFLSRPHVVWGTGCIGCSFKSELFIVFRYGAWNKEKDKLIVEAVFPEDNAASSPTNSLHNFKWAVEREFPEMNGLPISVAMAYTKAPHVIANEIKRKLLSDYAKVQAYLFKRVKEHEDDYARCFQTMKLAAGILGTGMPSRKERSPFDVELVEKFNKGETRVACKHGSDSGYNLEITGVNSQQLKKLIAILGK